MTGQRKPSPIPRSVRIIGEERRKQNAGVDYGSGGNVNIDEEDNLSSGISPDDNIKGDYSPGDGSTAPAGSRAFNSSIEEEKKKDIAKDHQDGKANNKSGNTMINIKNMIGDDDKKHAFEARRILHPHHDEKPQARDRSTRSSYGYRDGGQSVIPQPRVDLAKLSTESLSRYCQRFNIVRFQLINVE
ncbi:hypothetical protein K2173_022626 [Erythroxylum novogranatense]|uniref:Uncharacterized protein n=1 Tax=Erythroxylum novogranatense TaxID=1862640 RepID=A0AAV8TQ02_9ROSI|nr:hypothetical protein K2173_022626 [Erythroxylum novogranatense]